MSGDPMIARRTHAAAASQGFTLVEMAVVVLILGVVATGLYQMLTTSRDSYEQQKVTLEMQQNARVAIESLADDFRHVSYGKDPTQPSIHYAGPDSVTFVADVMPLIPGAEVISYALSPDGDLDTPNPNDTILMKTVADSGNVFLFHEPQSYGISVGGLAFRYFNGAGVELQNPVPQPELIGEIMIEVTAVAPRAHRKTGTYLQQVLSTTIYPRNLPLSPARSRPSTPPVGSLSVPDCESVTIPWQTPTTNTDGTPLPLNDISHFSVYFGTDPNDMSLYCRVARTINVWTISGLAGGEHYYFGVTCTSRSGVESYMGRDDLDLSSPLFPKSPTGITYEPNATGPGIVVRWDVVTEFVDDTAITTPLDYFVYRDDTPGVSPLPENFFATVPVSNWSVDSSLVNCQDYYYIVTAEACGNEGSPSSEIQAFVPAVPACASGIALALTENSGEIAVTWTEATQRSDGTPLGPEEITGYRVYCNTEPYTYTNYFESPGTDTQETLIGLDVCTIYYVNVTCLDVCPHEGEICTYNEVSIHTSEPCDPDPPAAPYSLRATAGNQQVSLIWPANDTDCDFYGYRVYYGSQPGGPYNGTEALQGTSPITYQAESVQQGDSCRVTLTGLQSCHGYALVVTGIDACDPPNESDFSPEATGQTDCTPCAVDAGCVHYLATGASFHEARLEIYPTNAVIQTLISLVPDWSGPALIRQVWAGRPLIKVWDEDGTAGENGPIGPQIPGAELDVEVIDVPSSAVQCDGLPLMLAFDQDQSMQTLDLGFRTSSGVCAASQHQIHEALVFDDFDDGEASDWTSHSGTWSVVDGELYQSKHVGTHIATLPGNLTDSVYEAKVCLDAVQTVWIVFRFVDTLNFYMMGIRVSTDQVRLGRFQNGLYTITDEITCDLALDTWYLLRAEVEGNTVRGYLDCQQVLQVTDPNIEPVGAIGLRTDQGRGLFDDIRVAAMTALP